MAEGDDFEGVSWSVQCEIIQQDMLGGQLQDKDIPSGGLDHNFIFPGFEANQLDQVNDQAPHLQLDQGNNLLPDLNLEPQAQQQIIEEKIPAQAVFEPVAQEQELQEEMDIQLNLSPPMESASSSILGNQNYDSGLSEEATQQTLLLLKTGSKMLLLKTWNRTLPFQLLPLQTLLIYAENLEGQEALHAYGPILNQYAELGFQPPIHQEVVLALPANINIPRMNPSSRKLSFTNLGLGNSIGPQMYPDLQDFLGGMMQTGKSNPNIYRLWAKYFSPMGCPEKTSLTHKYVHSPPRRGRVIPQATPEIETSVRRSLRIRDKNDGFKHSSCADKTCLACAATPPAFAISTIKEIGEKVCKIASEKLSIEALSAKSSSKKVIGDKMTPSKVCSSNKEVEKGKKKKVSDDANEASKKAKK
ncbi:uncharacterized protein C2845_PM13G11500 [Panicum miliaceum]|uniref:Uncharacterized protein n=1 Tax=Panicum miliaceum TaxID=4540 RepID=A0A3L6RK70_PANMI|nr:uncharacterized protein C2845_PM13G11500 [Panicum miliaceum]